MHVEVTTAHVGSQGELDPTVSACGQYHLQMVPLPACLPACLPAYLYLHAWHFVSQCKYVCGRASVAVPCGLVATGTRKWGNTATPSRAHIHLQHAASVSSILQFDPDEEGPEKEFYTYRVRVSNCG